MKRIGKTTNWTLQRKENDKRESLKEQDTKRDSRPNQKIILN
jgi:tmRNA-binding protein